MTQPFFDKKNDWEEFSNAISDKKAEQEADRSGSKPGAPAKETVIKFSLKPEELESYLNRYIIGQENAVEIIATKVCTHFNRMEIEKSIPDDEKVVGNIKSNMLLIGPTGVGKTYIIKLIAKKLGVPFVKADATKFSETGYVGGDVEDLVRELVHEADGDLTRAEYGIVYLDEIDKIASSGNFYGPDVSRTGVQRNLLKLMEDAEVDLKTPHDLASQVEAAMEAQKTGKVSRKKISTRNILFIVSGAFSSLDDIIKKRMNLQAIGFDKAQNTREEKKNILKEVKTEDLIQFGFESEFIGRLPVTVLLNELNEEGLFKILKNKYSSVVLGKKMDFKAYGIDLDFTDDALRILAKRAYDEKTGARGLLSVFENTLIKFEKTLPSTNISELMVDKEVVLNPDKELQKILLSSIEDDIKKFQKEFLLSHGIFLEFQEDAITAVKDIAFNSNKSINQLCSDYFHDYHYGIKLMEKDTFTITKEAVLNPGDYLNNYIKNNYNKEAEKKEEEQK
ncbi:MAG: AAA family ATPase [Spirochaetes bacterium]|nr:AAA family ATPase [Spirochaetota bacterium]